MSDDITTTITLRRPIREGTREITVLTLREPTTPEIRKIGLPFALRMDETMQVDAERVAIWLSKLSAVPPSTIDQMHRLDFMEACQRVPGFFMDGSGGSGSAPSPS